MGEGHGGRGKGRGIRGWGWRWGWEKGGGGCFIKLFALVKSLSLPFTARLAIIKCCALSNELIINLP